MLICYLLNHEFNEDIVKAIIKSGVDASTLLTYTGNLYKLWYKLKPVLEKIAAEKGEQFTHPLV